MIANGCCPVARSVCRVWLRNVSGPRTFDANLRFPSRSRVSASRAGTIKLGPTVRSPSCQVSHLAALIVRDRLANLLGGVHDEWSAPHDGLVDRFAAEQETRHALPAVD